VLHKYLTKCQIFKRKKITTCISSEIRVPVLKFTHILILKSEKKKKIQMSGMLRKYSKGMSKQN
jgi:hypothetical protein